MMPKKRPSPEITLRRKPGPRPKGAKTGMIRARVAPELKAEAESILAQIGLSSSDAIRMFYSQVTMRRGLPFRSAHPQRDDPQGPRRRRDRPEHDRLRQRGRDVRGLGRQEAGKLELGRTGSHSDLLE